MKIYDNRNFVEPVLAFHEIKGGEGFWFKSKFYIACSNIWGEETVRGSAFSPETGELEFIGREEIVTLANARVIIDNQDNINCVDTHGW